MANLAQALTWGVFAVIGVSTWAGGCASDPARKAVAEGCFVNTDCADQLVCVFRKCHIQCETTRDCDPGQLCVSGERPYHVCQLKEEQRCALNSDCPTGELCAVDLQCRDACAADRDCLQGQVCVSGTCAEDTELKDGGLTAKRADGEGGSGQPCLYTSQCPVPLVCRNNLCSSECLAASDCAAGYDCVNNRCVAGSGTLIGLAGGVVTANGGKVKLTIPANALRAPVSIVLLPVDAWPEGALGPVYQIEPNGLQFLAPATLTMTYTSALIGAVPPNNLRLAQARGASWSALASTLDTANSTVTTELAHLSVYGLIGAGVDSGAADDRAAPTDPSEASGAQPVDATGSTSTSDAAVVQDSTITPVRIDASAATGAL